jgi:dTMP kinase
MPRPRPRAFDPSRRSIPILFPIPPPFSPFRPSRAVHPDPASRGPNPTAVPADASPAVPAVARGRFITVEGIDGAGKSSHVQALAEAIEAAGHPLLRTREPGGTELAEALRALFLHREMDALTEALLVFAARRDHLQRVIAPALAAGTWVLCDRFTDATFAYQGAGRGFDTAVLAMLETWVSRGLPTAEGGESGESGESALAAAAAAAAVTGEGGSPAATAAAAATGATGATGAVAPAAPLAEPLLQPDLTLWFDVDPAEAARRRAAAREADRLEAEDLAFFDRVRDGYARRAAAHPQRIQRIDAGRPLDEVRAAALAALAARPWATAT